MPFFSPASSEQFIAPPAPQEAIVSDKLAALSADEPLPEIYHTDRLRLLAQSPRKLHLYWEFAHNPFDTLRRAFGPLAKHYRLIVRLVTLEMEETVWHEASPSRSQWFNVQPDKSYRAEVGFFAEGRAFIKLLSSSVMRTPRAGVSHRADNEPDFHVSPAEFARVLDEAGYASDALEVTLEAADLETRDGATRAVAGRLGGEPLAQLDETDLAELRGLLAALAVGINPDDLITSLSPTLAAWLAQLRFEHSESLHAAHLLEILRSTVGIQTSLAEYDELDEAEMRRVARFVVGASWVNMPRRPFHLWMPSMTAGIFKKR